MECKTARFGVDAPPQGKEGREGGYGHSDPEPKIGCSENYQLGGFKISGVDASPTGRGPVTNSENYLD